MMAKIKHPHFYIPKNVTEKSSNFSLQFAEKAFLFMPPKLGMLHFANGAKQKLNYQMQSEDVSFSLSQKNSSTYHLKRCLA